LPELAAFFIGLVVFSVAVATASPIILAAAFLLFLTPFRQSATEPSETLFIVFLWGLFLFFAVIVVSREKVSLRRFELQQYRTMANWKFAVSVVFFGIFLLFWITNLGISDFSGHHMRERSVFANVVNLIFRGISAYSVIVLGLANRKVQKRHLVLALMVLAATVAAGYLINKRGVVVTPIVTIIILRFFTLRGVISKLKFAVPVLIVLIGVAMVVIEMTAQRSHGDWIDGLESLETTIAGETGNALAPPKELKVLRYVETNGPFLEPYTLFSGFWGFIPRVIWQEKPDVGVGRLIGTIVFGTGGGRFDRGAGMPVSVAAQVAAIFGTAFYPVGIFGVASILVLVAVATKRYPILLFGLVSTAPWAVGSDIGRMQMGFIMTTAVLWVTFRVVGLRLVYRSASRGRAALHKRAQAIEWRRAWLENEQC
jgi:hypothetical protein